MSLNPVPTAQALWLATLSASGRRPATLAVYTYATDQLVTWRVAQGGDADLTTVSRFEALAFVRYLTDSYKPSGVESRVKALKAFGNWCVAEGLIEASPWARITVTVPEEVRPTADDSTVEAMLGRAKRSRRDHALLTVLTDTGARKGELAAVEVQHVDLTSGTITFPVSKSRARVVPLSDRCVVALGRWLRQRGMGAGSLWSVADPYSLVRQATKRHSAGKLTPHMLRRRFAVAWLAKGGSELGLMRVAGWSSREMIALYTRASADQLAAAEMRKLMA